MTVRARLNRQHVGLQRRWRQGRSTHAVARRDTGTRPAAQAEGARVHEAGPPQDQALYTCQCGYVFEATVSTSVDCPHCGNTQAW